MTSVDALCKENSKIFEAKKAKILSSLDQPSDSYTDASPKGSIDEGIRQLIDLINSIDSFVTTSSCAGRVVIFRESPRNSNPISPFNEKMLPASSGTIANSGKGTGGRWLYVSHNKLDRSLQENSDLLKTFGLATSPELGTNSEQQQQLSSYVHFKFEPMILHVQTASIDAAQDLLSVALQAGFRESGVTGLKSACPMVAVRCQGLALDSIIGIAVPSSTSHESNGVRQVSLVSEHHIEVLVSIANQRFDENSRRIERFFSLLNELKYPAPSDQEAFNKESKDARRMRKRAEGLL